VIPRGYPQVPVRTKVTLAPWFALLVIALAWGSDHGLVDLHGMFADVGKVPHRTHHSRQRAAPAVPAGSMAPASIYGYARRAGFTPAEARTATAIALAESGGRPRAHNPKPPDDSYCLMQVNMLGPLGPERRARFHLRSNADLYDPATCMRAAYGISGGGSTWRPWTTYTRGDYRRYLALSNRLGRG
jgi:hypothetical protein